MAIKEEWIKKMWHVYTVEYYSNVDGPTDYHIKWSKWDRERQFSYNITYIWTLKKDINELIYKIEIDSQTQTTNLWLLKEIIGWGEW